MYGPDERDPYWQGPKIGVKKDKQTDEKKDKKDAKKLKKTQRQAQFLDNLAKSSTGPSSGSDKKT